MTLNDLLNFYLNSKKNFRSATAYSRYVRNFQNAIIGHGDIVTEFTRIIQLTSNQVANTPGYDPVADALSFFNKMIILPNISSMSSKTKSDWRSGYTHFAKTILGQFYANTWIFSSINDQTLCDMVAKSAIFADKDIVSKVVSGQLGTNKNKGVGNPEACWDHYTKCRDNNVKKGNPTTDCNGIPCIADDNTEANKAIKNAILEGSMMQSITPTGGYRLFKDYEACHIWGLVDDCHYYTSIANLVLIPRAISGMSDHCQAVIDLLRYESYKRFGILPKGQVIPQKPQGYNSLKWRN